MKTQRTKLVARIAVALLAGMMVLALAGCDSENPLKGHTYTDNEVTYTFKGKKLERRWGGGKKEADTYTYTLDSESLTGTCYTLEGRRDDTFGYTADGSSVTEGSRILEKVK